MLAVKEGRMVCVGCEEGKNGDCWLSCSALFSGGNTRLSCSALQVSHKVFYGSSYLLGTKNVTEHKGKHSHVHPTKCCPQRNL